MKQQFLFDIGPAIKPVKRVRRPFVGRRIASFYGAIVPEPMLNGKPLDGIRFKILQTVNGELFLFDKEASLGKGVVRYYIDIREAIDHFERVEPCSV